MSLLALALALAGCGDDDPPADAGGGDADAATPEVDAAEIAIDPPAAPQRAVAPALLPCPIGWAPRATRAGVAYCDPFPEGRKTCSGATGQRPGDRECTRIGPPCPEGEWADPIIVPDGRIVLYVRPGAIDGDGTRDRPFGTIAEAIAIAPHGTTIALAKGNYPDVLSIELADNLELRGACAAETIFDGDRSTSEEDYAEATIAVRAGVLTLRAMTIRSPEASGVDVDGTTILNAYGVAFDGVYGSAVAGRGQAFVASDIVVRTTQLTGAAIGCLRGRCRISDASFETSSLALTVFETDGSCVRCAAWCAGDSNTAAFNAGSRSSMTLSEVTSYECQSAFGSGGETYDVDRGYVYASREGFLLSSSSPGRIARTYGGGKLSIEVPPDSGTTELVDVVLEGPGGEMHGDLRRGIEMTSGSTLALERVSLEAYEGIAIVDADLTGHDVSFLDAIGGPPGTTTMSVQAMGAKIDLQRVLVDGSEGSGMLFWGGTRARLGDLTMLDVGAEDRGAFGLALFQGTTLELERASLERMRGIGMIANGVGTRVVGVDVAIDGTLPLTSNGQFGGGIEAEGGAEVDLERVRVTRTRGHAVAALGSGRIVLREASVLDTAPRACGEGECADAPFGMAIGAYGASIELDGFELRRAALCGAHVGPGAEVAFHRGLVTESAIGVCLQSTTIDLDALSSEVQFIGNESNLDTVSLPVPVAAPSVVLPDRGE